MEPWMISVAAGLVSIGGAYGGAKVALNGTRERVKEVKADLSAHMEKDEDLQDRMIDRLARIETKLDILMEKR